MTGVFAYWRRLLKARCGGTPPAVREHRRGAAGEVAGATESIGRRHSLSGERNACSVLAMAFCHRELFLLGIASVEAGGLSSCAVSCIRV